MAEEKIEIAERVKKIIEGLAAAIGGAYWQLGLGFMGWQTVAPAIRSGILSPLDRAFTATYRYRNATAANVARAWIHNLISTEDFITYLKNLGYDDTAIAIIVNYYAFDKYEELAKEKIERMEIEFRAKKEKLEEEIDFLEDALSLALGYTKVPEKKHRYRLKEYEALMKMGADTIREMLIKTKKQLEDLENSFRSQVADIRFFGDSDLIARVWRDIPTITITWYGIKELLKPIPERVEKIAKPPEVVPARPPEVPAPPAPPARPPAPPKPPVKPAPPAKAEIKHVRVVSPSHGSTIKTCSRFALRFAWELTASGICEFKVRWSIDLKADKFDSAVREILKNFAVRKISTCVYETTWIQANFSAKNKGETGIGYFHVPEELKGRKLIVSVVGRGKGTEKIIIGGAEYKIE